MGVWVNYELGKIFISKDYYNDINHQTFVFSLQDHTENTLLLSQARSFQMIKYVINNFKLGNVYFENQKIKHNCYELFGKLM